MGSVPGEDASEAVAAVEAVSGESVGEVSSCEVDEGLCGGVTPEAFFDADAVRLAGAEEEGLPDEEAWGELDAEEACSEAGSGEDGFGAGLVSLPWSRAWGCGWSGVAGSRGSVPRRRPFPARSGLGSADFS
ncbi:hypothetical protein DZF91_03875 [Actinomadura logoneensis]|uniref:Uncharacterized protein n=1 Tax=Actinomadura logoneensis TaxID=2293572 RepID=A0A372JUB3_9ACTN|nr:hypothetical protein [Actinomadura logoneensis]RFU42938.1 hypothetical protein DZF91_03875 [Actinomadura logoneensis]